jgi:hypothetical protein
MVSSLVGQNDSASKTPIKPKAKGQTSRRNGFAVTVHDIVLPPSKVFSSAG